MASVPHTVVVAGGHRTDAPDRSQPRFPTSAVAGVRAAMETALARWRVGRGDLLVTGGARGADLLAAEAALARGAAVALLLALPAEEFLDRSVRLEPGAADEWEERFRTVLERSDVRVQDDKLGPLAGGENRFARNNQWCLAFARAAAPAGGLRALLVWNGQEGDGPGGAADLANELRLAGVEVEVIDPLEAAT
jgi:hypothetical protein